MPDFTNLTCPIPIQQYPRVLMAHGGGGRLMHQLISSMFVKAFANPILEHGHDSAVCSLPGNRVAITTDSYVVQPLFFPGGNIGSMAIHGTINDLAMAGAVPHYITAAFIIEEGLSMETLWQIASSMGETARRCGVAIVTGDTKVVDRDRGDGCFINTTGVGVIPSSITTPIEPQSIQPGDILILSGDLGRHGMAIMAVREGLQFETTIESDSAPVHEPVLALIQAGLRVHCLRDLTRGGLAATANELASTANLHFEIHQRAIPVNAEVDAACELLGLDVLQVANEGRFILIIHPEDAARALEILKQHPVSTNAAIIGTVQPATPGNSPRVILRSPIGTARILDMPVGEQLPRIC